MRVCARAALGSRAFGSLTTVRRFGHQFRHVLVDEFQDTSAPQCELLLGLASVHRNAFLVGDPQQCIYTWRQAERANLTRLAAAWGGEGKLVRLALTRSYRSTKRLLRCARRILSARLVLPGLEGSVPVDPHEAAVPELWTENAEGARLSYHAYEDVAAEAAGVAHHLARLLAPPRLRAQRDAADGVHPSGDALGLGALSFLRGGGPAADGNATATAPLRPSEVAILARTGRQLAPIRQALERVGVPCAMHDGGRLVDRVEVRVVVSYLQLLIDPSDIEAFTHVAKAAKGLGDVTLRHVLDEAKATSRSCLVILQQLSRFNGHRAAAGSAHGARKAPSAAVAQAAAAVCHDLERLSRMLAAAEPLDAIVRAAAALAPPPSAARPSSKPPAGAGESSRAPQLQSVAASTSAAAPVAATTFATAATFACASSLAASSAVPSHAATQWTAAPCQLSQANRSQDGHPSAAAPPSEHIEALLRLAAEQAARPHQSRDSSTLAEGRDGPTHGSAASVLGASRAGDGESARDGLQAFLLSVGLGVDAGSGADTPEVVSLSTAHRAKGLEWRLVWIVGAEDGLFPSARSVREAATSNRAPEPSLATTAVAMASVLREEQRLLFVSATRAREALVFSQALSRYGEPTRPSPFLRALPVADTEPRVFLPPSLAAARASIAECVCEAEANACSEGAARQWLAALDARLQLMETPSDAAAQEHSFLLGHYGASYAVDYAIEKPTSDGEGSDRGDGGDGGDSDGGVPGGRQSGARASLQSAPHQRMAPRALLSSANGVAVLPRTAPLAIGGNRSNVFVPHHPHMQQGETEGAWRAHGHGAHRPGGGKLLGGRRPAGGAPSNPGLLRGGAGILKDNVAGGAGAALHGGAAAATTTMTRAPGLLHGGGGLLKRTDAAPAAVGRPANPAFKKPRPLP